MFRKKILVVDDDSKMTEMLQDIIEVLGHKPVLFHNGVKALKYLKRHHCDLVITDIHMPEMSGFGLIKVIRAARPYIPIIVITGMGDERYARTIESMPGTRYLTKPFSLMDISSAVSELLARAA